MKATHGRKLLNGDIANLSIGQGDTQVTPLQMAQAMSIVANGGTFYQTRLVQQVQSIDGGIVTAYNVREKKTLNFSSETMAQLRTGMVDAVNAPAGTAHAASLETVTVAGKTGTAQWGPKNKERTAAWFAGYVPAEKPQYAFAALYEGDVGVKAHGGTVAAPMIAQVLEGTLQRRPGQRPPPSPTSSGGIANRSPGRARRGRYRGLTRISCRRGALSGSIGSFGAATERRNYSAGDYLRKLELDQALIHHRIRNL